MRPNGIYKFILQKLLGACQHSTEIYLKSYKPTGRILMFHDVYKNNADCVAQDIAISKKHFEALINRLLEQHHFVPLLNGESILNMKEKDISITFDDIFLSAYENAIPLLESNNIPYTVFISPNLLNKSPYITTAQLSCILQSPLCSLGAHTMNHKMLRFLDASEALYEIQTGKEWLQEAYGRPVNMFAYPYGSFYACKRQDVNLVYSSGYHIAFSTINAHLSARTNLHPLWLPRINVNDNNYDTI